MHAQLMAMPNVMELPVAPERASLPTRAAAERAAFFMEWVQEHTDFAVPSDALMAEVRAEAKRRGIDCHPRYARQWRESGGPGGYWALVIDPGFPVDPLLWEGDDA